MPNLKLGVICRTGKENEQRLPIHPDHFDRIDADLRSNIYLEHGYGEHFGVSASQLSALSAGMRSREQLIAECDVILLTKPDASDLAELRPGSGVDAAGHRPQADLDRIRIDELVGS